MPVKHNLDAFDQKVRLQIYRHFIRTGRAPSPRETARALSCSERGARTAYRRLARSHALVLHQGSDEILRAAPFWAVPTRFPVEVAGRSYWGSCIWDALGIPVMLGKNARILGACGCCDQSMVLEVKNGALATARGVAHIALPARRWYDDIVFT